MARPSEFSDEITSAICQRLADGETLREICRDEAMPARSTVHLWLLQHETFSDQYARAREIQVDGWADEIVEIADDGTNDFVGGRNVRLNGVHAPTVEDTEPRFNGEHVQRSKLRVDTRKWLMAKAAPKKYGDRISMEHEGAITLRHEDALSELE